MAHSEEGARVCVQSLGIKPGGPNPGGPALGKPRSCFNVNFNSYAHGLRSGTKVPLALFSFCWNGSLIRLPKKIKQPLRKIAKTGDQIKIIKVSTKDLSIEDIALKK